MGPLTLDELAVAAGTSGETIARLSELGLLLPVDDDGLYPFSNISRIRLLLAQEAEGVSLGSIAETTRSGRFGLAFIDQLMPSPGRLLPETYGQMAARFDAALELMNVTRTVLGTTGASAEEQVREDDAAILQLAIRAQDLGATEEQIARVMRTIAHSVRRIVRTQRDFVDELLIMPKIASGVSPGEALESTTPARHEFRMIGAELTTLLLRRFVDDAIFQSIVELGERALRRDGMVPARGLVAPAIAFVDVSGYTKIADTLGDEAAARAATRFAMLVDRVVTARGGRLVKLLGDGAMLAFPNAPAAVRCSVDLVGRTGQEGLPPIHVGIDAGEVVRRDGDYFGSVVNVASRVAELAGPRQVLVTDRVAIACRDERDLQFVAAEPTVLKNIARPVTLHLANLTAG
ncbi:MAG TPA: adenylate/guanylate cyclase domain-containing protein [Mycobacterium sp.]|nr:adenylate/guanylate cyclase domain-containing protein [Mycobacterium sp.]